MGNVSAGGDGIFGWGLDSLCASRGFPPFVAPNAKHATYRFDYQVDQTLKLIGEELPIDSDGFSLRSQIGAVPSVAKWYTLKEYAGGASSVRLGVSGRWLIHVPHATAKERAMNVSAFRVGVRGCPVYHSVKTASFTHVAQVSTTGVFFSVSMAVNGNIFYLCPQIIVVLENGEEVVLVDDRLGPLQRPRSFFVDFAAVDAGGRDVQLDLIFRGAPSQLSGIGAGANTSPDPTLDQLGSKGWTLRTCLHDYAAVNSQVWPASITIGYSGLSSRIPDSSVYLQHLVVSEKKLQAEVRGDAGQREPFELWREATHRPDAEASSTILFEGQDARMASMAIVVPEAPVQHPQLQPLRGILELQHPGGLTAYDAVDAEDAHQPAIVNSRNGEGRGRIGEGADRFWYHIRYDDIEDDEDLGADCLASQLKGEFWLSKEVADRNRSIYFHCSSTLAQALTMCIGFRFGLPENYLALIASHDVALRDAHIPTNGLILGIERDPRHHSIMRMFMEHHNEIVDDMAICECRPSDLARCVVHQEIHDAGGRLSYRLTLLHGDGARQTATLQKNMDEIEEFANNANHGNFQVSNEPSTRFPITPCSAHKLLPNRRIFVYTGVSYRRPVPMVGGGAQRGSSVGGSTTGQGGGGGEYASVGFESADDGVTSEGLGCHSEGEDWQSVASVICSEGGKRKYSFHHGHSNDQVLWRRPLIESVVLLGSANPLLR